MELIEKKEVQDLILELIESIFDYENESGNRINQFDRTPEGVQKIFIDTYLNNLKI